MLIVPTAADLRSCVATLWAGGPGSGISARERVLPSGTMHLAVRLDGDGVRLFDDDADRQGRRIAHAVVAGTRDRYYLKDTHEPSRSVGAVLRPGAARALFGCGADAFANRHVALADLVGDAATALHEELAATTAPAGQIAVLQAFLLRCLRPVRALHPPIAAAIEGLAAGTGVAGLVASGNCSHKRFIAQFRDATGLAPKCYARVARLQRMLETRAHVRWSDAALAAGYSDQAHMNREFRALTGVTPQAWRTTSAASTHHLPADKFVQYPVSRRR